LKNLVELLGEIERDNTGLSFYEDNPELLDKLGEEGVQVTEGNLLFDILNMFTPKSEKGRMQAFGNQIYIPTDEMSDEDIAATLGHYLNVSKSQSWSEEGGWEDPVVETRDALHELPYDNLATAGIFEELPHVQQFRDKGFLGMALEGSSAMFENFFKQLSEGNYKTAFNPRELQKTLYDDPHSHEGFHDIEPEKARLINEFLGEGAYFEHRGWPYTEGEPLKAGDDVPDYPGYEYDGVVIPSYTPENTVLESMGDTEYDYWDEQYGDSDVLVEDTDMPIDMLMELFPEHYKESIESFDRDPNRFQDTDEPDEELEPFEHKEFIPADINEDGVVNILDILRLGDYEKSDDVDFDRLLNQSLYTDYMQD